jgi:hypothetical protein
MDNNDDLFTLDSDERKYCWLCGNELQYGEPYYIYQDLDFCKYCAVNESIIWDAIEIDYT